TRLPVLVDEARVELTSPESRMRHRPGMERDSGLETNHMQLAEGPFHSPQHGRAIACPDDELAEQRVVVTRHLGSGVQHVIEAHSRPRWLNKLLHPAREREEVQVGI